MGHLIALAGLALGLGDRQVGVFERACAAELASNLGGSSKKVSVQVEPDPIGVLWGALDRATIYASDFEVDALPFFVESDRSKAGRCGNLRLELKNFRLKSLRVESLTASIPACRYDRALALSKKQFRLTRSGTGTGTVRLLQSDLAAFVLKKYHEIKSVDVFVRDGIVWVEGSGEFLLVKTGFTVIAELSVVDGTKLMLDKAKVWFDWRRADDFAAQTLLKTLNPVVDLDADLGLLGAMKVEKVTLEGGVLEASGKALIPSRPPAPIAPKRVEGLGSVRPTDLLSRGF